MGRKRKYSDTGLAELAKQYTSKHTFKQEHASAYQTAYVRGIWPAISAHMVRPVKWTTEMLKTEADKYANKTDFQQLSSSAHQTAYARGILNSIFTKNKRTKNWVLYRTQFCSTYEDFCTNERGAHRVAVELGILDSIQTDMFNK